MNLNQSELKHNFFYLDLLSVLSAFSVVMLHGNCVIWQYPAGSLWISCNIIECLFYFAVPVFFMISGATLIDFNKRSGLKDYFCKRFKRTVLPFIICSAAAFFIYADWSWRDFGDKSFYIELFTGIFQYKYMGVYWFFYPLFALYLSIPVLAQIQDKIRTFTYLIIYGALSLVVLPFICRLCHWNTPLQQLASPLTGGFVLYLLIGYVLHNTNLKRCWRMVIYAGGWAGVLMHFFGTIHFTPPGGPFAEYFKGYLNLPAMLQAAAIFLFIKENTPKEVPPGLKKLVDLIKPHTLGIYLLHMYFINLIVDYFNSFLATLWFRTLGSLLIFMLSCLLASLLTKIPVLKLALGK